MLALKTKCACLVSSPSQLILRAKPRPQQVCSFLSHVDVRRDITPQTTLGRRARSSHHQLPHSDARTTPGQDACTHQPQLGGIGGGPPRENRAGTQKAGCWLRTHRRGSFDNIINFSPPAWATLREVLQEARIHRGARSARWA